MSVKIIRRRATAAFVGAGALASGVAGCSSLRFSQLERQIPEVTQKVLIQQLRSLEADGVIARVARPVVPPHVEYRLTDDGRRLRETLEALDRWTRARNQAAPRPERIT